MQCAAPRRRASSSRPGAVSCGCKTCHCARRQPYISRWTSEAAAVDLQLTVCPAVGPRWHWRAKKAKHKSAGNQPAGWTATSTARPAEVWKGARDTVDCDEQQHVELSTNDNRHGLKMVPTGAVWRRFTARLLGACSTVSASATLPRSRRKSGRRLTRRTPRSSPRTSTAAHTGSSKASAPPAAVKFCVTWQFDGSDAARYLNQSTPKFFA